MRDGEPLRMLEAHVVAHAVDVAEVEQAGADDRAHARRGGIEVDLANGARLGVGERERIAGDGDPHRLGERGLGMRPVVQLLGAGARDGAAVPPRRDRASRADGCRPWRRTACRRRARDPTASSSAPAARSRAVRSWRAGAGDRAHGARRRARSRGWRDCRRRRRRACRRVEGETLRMAKARRVAIGEARAHRRRPRARRRMRWPPARAADEDAMVAGVGDGDASPSTATLPGIGADARARSVGGSAATVQRLLDGSAPSARAAASTRSMKGATRVGGELAGSACRSRAPRVDGDERGPCAHGIGTPDAELPVVQDRMDRRPGGWTRHGCARCRARPCTCRCGRRRRRRRRGIAARAPATAGAHGCS